MARISLAALLSVAGAANISDDFLGTWTPVNHTTVHSPMGPSGLFQHFKMSKNASNGDYWMSAIEAEPGGGHVYGQVFRVRDDIMQYCFANSATSPFVVDSVEESKVVFCYKTGERMKTHRADGTGLATGCDAAQLSVELLTNKHLEFKFMMSPPVVHASALFERTGPPPPVEHYVPYNLGDPCDPKHPRPPTLTSSLSSSAMSDAISSMCPVATRARARVSRRKTAAALGMVCRQLDSGSWFLNPTERVDVRLQYAIPAAPCWPCNVSYSVSAGIDEDQYIAVGFKGMAYRAMIDELRPGYFGMATDEVDETRTGRAIVLGYIQSAGGCVREMTIEDYVGTPFDVPGNPNIFNESVERLNGRTVVRFTVEQHVGRSQSESDDFFNTEQLSARIMWAIGKVKAAPSAPSYTCSVCAHVYDAHADGDGVAFDDLPETWTCPICGQPKSVYKLTSVQEADTQCGEEIQYHTSARGVSPLAWFDQNPLCDASELGVLVEDPVVIL